MENMEEAAQQAETQKEEVQRLDQSISSSCETPILRGSSKLSQSSRPVVRKIREVDSSAVKELLKVMRANDDQKEFWEVWAKYIHDKALADEELDVFQRIHVSLDLRWLEIHTIAEKNSMVKLLRQFLENIGCLQKEQRTEGEQAPQKQAEGAPTSWKRMFDDMTMVLDHLDQAKAGKELKIKVWCRFKNMRMNNPRPGIDFGFLVRQESFQWSFLDVLLHPTEDQEILRNFCSEHGREAREGYCPQWYGSTLLPTNPERQLAFEIKETVATNYKQIILQAFFFFKAMGLMKPEDAIVRTLQKAGSSRIHVDACFGPNGLTRISLSVFNLLERSFNREENVTPTVIIDELVKELDLQYSQPDISKIEQILGGKPDIIEYIGETNGYGLRLGFTYPLYC